jgi:catechol 2,3-dioxygenase-like lactoylglutathione lyase family enzyme
MKKTHLSLRTRDLKRGVDFYAVLLDAKPVKQLEDYALFITDEPGLELALSPDPHVEPDTTMHFGIAAQQAEAVDQAIARLKAAGFPHDIESEKICCYARQNKVWATDPDGRRWEVYYVIEETAARMDADSTCCTGEGDTPESATCCPA